MKTKLLFLSLVWLAISGSLHAQTNTARMVAGLNTVTSCPYTLQPTDVTFLVVFNSSSACAVTLPSVSTSGYGLGSIFSVKNDGAGTVTISSSSLISGGTVTLTTGQGADIYGGLTTYEVQSGSGIGGGSGCPQGSNYSVQYLNPVTGACSGAGPGIIGQAYVSVGASSAPAPASPGLTDSSNSPVSTTPYTIACDSATTIVDRAHILRFTGSAAAVTIPLSTGSGCAGLVVTAFNDGASTVTFSVTSPDVVNLYDGAAATDSLTSFPLNSGQSVTLSQGASGLWEARKSGATVCSTSQKSETGADTNVLTCTPVSAAGTYRLHLNLSLSAASSATLGWTATWKDSNGNSQSPTNLPICISSAGTCAGTTGALSSAVTASGDYYIDVNNAGTNIVIKLTFSGTSFTGKVSATIERLI